MLIVERGKAVRPFYCGNVSDTKALLVELYLCGVIVRGGRVTVKASINKQCMYVWVRWWVCVFEREFASTIKYI